MNTLVIPNEGKTGLLDYQIRTTITGVNPWTLRLFQNNATISETTVLADLTQATFTGYAGVTMTRSSWSSPVIVANHARSTWLLVPTQWVNTGSTQTIYGCYYTDDDLNVVRGVFKFNTPIVVAPGGTIAVLPEFSYATEVVP